MATILTSYDLKGKKDSFANWISNLSPTDTFFVSTTGKEQVQNTLFQWQVDSLAEADLSNAQDESSNSIASKHKSTRVYANITQILRKSVEVSDTADAISSWGRGKELAYQMEKAGKEIKRDLEAILLSPQSMTKPGAGPTRPGSGPDQFYPRQAKDMTHVPAESDTQDAGQVPAVNAYAPDATEVDATAPRRTACFQALVGLGKDGKEADEETNAIVTVHAKGSTAQGSGPKPTEEELFGLTYNLYLAGADANVIMYDPKLAPFFGSLMEVSPFANGNRTKMIDNMDTTLNRYVGTVVDPLGQEFKLIPNRWMPKGAIYIFNPKDWTQMVLREPQKVKLAKRGSTERYMIEMEVGLRHRNPYASGVYLTDFSTYPTN